MSQAVYEVERGERFGFGANWTRFLRDLDDFRIRSAEVSLCAALEVPNLEGATFLDVGCGSGLFSLAARRLGATVRSFDYDPKSVACAAELRRRYFPDDSRWIVEEGSALDSDYLRRLGKFDVVYSWGVLHHTGNMVLGLENVAKAVAPGGKLYIAIYNNQGGISRRWTYVKKIYNNSPRMLRAFMLAIAIFHFWWKPMLVDILSGHPGKSWREYKNSRGMAPIHDIVDWIGGYPFEVATPELIFDFYRKKRFQLVRLKTCQNLGCNEFVFELPECQSA